jgi:hypothetical protein
VKRSFALPIIAAAGILLLVILAPRVHPAALWGISCDRDQSQVRAREISSLLGIDTAGWEATVTGGSDSKAGYFNETHPALAEARRFSPVYPKVALKAPTGNSRVLVKLSASGEFNRWEWKGYKPSKDTDEAAARTLAQSAFNRLMGKDAPAFHPVPDPMRNETSLLFAFERLGPSAERFEATVSGHSLVKAELTADYGPEKEGGLHIATTLSDRKKYISWFTGAVGVVIYFLGSVLAACVYIFWAMRRAVKHRFVLALSALIIPWGAVYWTNWMGYDERYSSLAGGGSLLENFLGGVAILACLIAFYIILVGATDAIGLRPKLVALRSLFSSSLGNRHAGNSVFAGLLCGPLLAALPMAVSALRLFGSQRTGDYDAGLIFSAHPALQALNMPVSTALIGLFGFGTGFLARYIKKQRLSTGLLALLGILLFATNALPSETSPFAFLLSGTLLFVAYYQLFLRLDLLAVLCAGWSSQVIWTATTQVLQPAATVRSSGIVAFGFLAFSAGCAALLAWRGRELALDEDTAPAVVTSRREALMKEFSIAHRVQQQMLPEQPPAIPGCTVSASCQPAQEVGGDLFDFLRLPDGRWTIGVGDVSGKGVPAALYMTLTKGLLMATTQDSNDLVDIIGNVNHHIHAATEKKTFVTMALGAFDPETRSFDHVRAGHNPIVWRQPTAGATSLLNSPGLGLGIVSDRLFRRSVKLNRLQLAAGDALVFYSDGVTEAMNADREQFGEDRLMQAVEEADGLAAAQIREHILTRVREFLAGIAPQDDMTIVVLRVN